MVYEGHGEGPNLMRSDSFLGLTIQNQKGRIQGLLP